VKFLVTGATGFIGWRVVSNLLARGIPVVALDFPGDPEAMARLRSRAGTTALTFVTANVAEFHEVMAVLHVHGDITHVIHLAYLMSAECEANPHLAVRVNVLGMVNLFEAVLQKKLMRLIFTSSETYYGAKQEFFGDRDVTEDDFAPPSQHHFTYGAMKVLNELKPGPDDPAAAGLRTRNDHRTEPPRTQCFSAKLVPRFLSRRTNRQSYSGSDCR